MSKRKKQEPFIDKILNNYKKTMIIPVIILLFSVGVLIDHKADTGEFISKGIDFKGGSQAYIELQGSANLNEIAPVARERLGGDVILRELKGATNVLTIETEVQLDEESIVSILEETNTAYESVSIRAVGAALGSAFWAQAEKAVLFAFIAMAIVVFITFRSVVPSLAVMIAGVSDILFAMAAMNLLEIKLSLASLAALLMLIGYSVDTDILLSTRVLKKSGEGTINERVKSSMKTGLTMSVAAIVAFVVLYLVSTSAVLDQIALVIILGLLADIPNTWFQNVGILRIYLEKKGYE